MNIKFNLVAILIVLTSILVIFTPVDFMYAQDEELPSLPGRAQGTGTYFYITDSDYLNISLQSSEEIAAKLESVPSTISFFVEVSFFAVTTELIISGLEPDTPYYKYEDSYQNEAIIMTDEDGAYS